MSQYPDPQAEAMKKFEPKRVVANIETKSAAVIKQADNIADTSRVLSGNSSARVESPGLKKVTNSGVHKGNARNVRMTSEFLTRQEREIKLLEAKLETVRELYADVRTNNSDLMHQLSEMTKQRDNVTSQLIEAYVRLENVVDNEYITELSKQLEIERCKCEILSVENHNYAERTKILESQINERDERIMQLETKSWDVTPMEWNAEILSIALRDEKLAVKNLEDKLQAMSSQCSSMNQDEFDSITAQLINEKEKNNTLETDLQFLRAQRDTTQQELDARAAELDAINTKSVENCKIVAIFKKLLANECSGDSEPTEDATNQFFPVDVLIYKDLNIANAKVQKLSKKLNQKKIALIRLEHKYNCAMVALDNYAKI